MKQKIYFSLLTFILISCNTTNEKKDILKTISGNSKNYSLQYEIIYSEKELEFCLTSLYDKITEVSCETLIKKTDGYYSKNSDPKGLSDSKDYNLILSVDKDTSYVYKSAGNINSLEIKKINNSLFKSTSKLTGMSNFKQVIFYDKEYTILKIERDVADKKYLFEKDI